jgi:hypothetical protein
VLRSDGQRAADGAGRSQLLDDRRGGWALRAAPAAALAVRAVWDEQRVLDIASAWAAGHLDDGDAVLIVDETADEKSSTDAVGAARQYSGTVGGIALCQVAVTLTYATGRGHALIGRALYLPEACAVDEEYRELAASRRRSRPPPTTTNYAATPKPPPPSSRKVAAAVPPALPPPMITIGFVLVPPAMR